MRYNKNLTNAFIKQVPTQQKKTHHSENIS